MTARFTAQANTLKLKLSLANNFSFVRKLLPVAVVLAMATPAHALEAMTEDSMSDATGEGLALFFNNFQFQMPSVAGDVSQSGTPAVGNNYGAGTATFGGSTYVPGNFGTYIYLSPLGSVPGSFSLGSVSIVPNRTDVFVYGLSISENDNTSVTTTAGTLCTATVFNSSGQVTTAGAGCIPKGSVVAPANGLSGAAAHNTLFNPNASGGINWGSATDPFLLTVSTTNSPSGSTPGIGGGTPKVPFLQISAPSAALAANDSSNNLRLGMWLNILQVDQGNQAAGGNNTLGKVGTAGPALQLQAIWDGFGINGTVINAFPTDPCTVSGASCIANPSGAAGKGNSAYANTLGFAGVLRFNSQPTGVLRLSVGGAPGTSTTADFGKFNAYEGIYLQQLNINLPLGNINYQPLILSSGATAKDINNNNTAYVSPTITLELAQIPNIASVYNQFYVNYDPNCTISGTTCTSTTTNSYANSGAIGLTPSAGMCSSGFGSVTACPATATHGNISIGNVYVNTTSSVQTAPNGDVIYPGTADALYLSGTSTPTTLAGISNTTGISFKAPDVGGSAINLGNAAISGLSINHLKMTLTGL